MNKLYRYESNDINLYADYVISDFLEPHVKDGFIQSTIFDDTIVMDRIKKILHGVEKLTESRNFFDVDKDFYGIIVYYYDNYCLYMNLKNDYISLTRDTIIYDILDDMEE